jgi:hypothetical protein
MNSLFPAALLASLIFGGALHGLQDVEKRILISDFEGDTAEWSGLTLGVAGVNPDNDSKIAITHEAASVKSGKGALSYSYEITPKIIRVLALRRPMDLTGMKSLHLWVKCSHATSVIIGLGEASGASYQANAHCPAGAWQEIAVNLDELTVDDRAKDPNGKLDLDQIGSITIFDIAGFAAMFLPDIKGPRTMVLDDISFSSKPVAATTGPAQVTRVVPIYLVDNFESSVIRWIPISLEVLDAPKFSLFDAPVAVDKDVPPGGGKQSLKFSYPRKAKKFHGIMRNLEKVDLSKATTLDLSLKSSHDGTFLVTLEEKDGSRYNKKVDLLLGDWKSFSWPLSEFTLAEDSQDENGKLDADQIKQITISDVTTLLGAGEADQVHLWVDQVLFVLSP